MGVGGVVGEMGNKAISAFNSVEVEVEAELGNLGHFVRKKFYIEILINTNITIFIHKTPNY